MSEATGTFILDTGSGTGTVYTRVEVTIQDRAGYADTQSTITVRVGAKLATGGQVYSSGVKGNIIIDATKVVEARTIFGCGTQYTSDGNYVYIQASRNVTKGHTARTAEYCYGEYHQYYENSDQGYKLTTWPSPRVVIPAKTSYTVSYNANGGSSAPSSQTKWYGESLTLTTSKPTRTGYTFAGWNTSSDGTGTNYASGATYNGNANLTLYAKWTKNTWVVTFMAQGDSGWYTWTGTKEYNTPLALPRTLPSSVTKQYYDFIGWNTSADGSGTAYSKDAYYTDNANVTLYAQWKVYVPEAPTSLSIVRESDYRSVIEWTRPQDADTTWQQILIYRSVNGADFGDEPYASIAGTATSYADTNTLPNNYYRYRLRAYNSGGSGQYSQPATTGYVYNTPAAPAGITAARDSENPLKVYLTLSNQANTATDFGIEYSTDGETWGTSGMTVVTSQGTPVTYIEVTMTGGGTFYYRVRNVGTHGGTTLSSPWTESDPLVTITPPAAPTLNSPAPNGVVQWVQNATQVVFRWTHNPLDGTSQSAAQLQYSINGGTAVTVSVTSAQTYTLTANISVNSTVSWRVRTKGAAADYGEWASSQSFSVYKAPALTVTEPSATIKGSPIDYEATYSDESGRFASGTLTVLKNGTAVYSESLPYPDNMQQGTIEGAIFGGEFIPEDGSSYTFRFNAVSETGLTATAQVTQSVDMEAPNTPTITITNDPETGYVSIIFGWDEQSGGQEAVNATLYRVTSQGRKQLAFTTTNNASCLDMYAPLNTDYTYLVVSQAESLEMNPMEFPNRLDTGWWFVYWNGKIARAKWNPNGSRTITRPERTRVHYIGRKYPVSYDGTAVDDEATMDWAIIDRQHAQKFNEMVEELGRGIYKSGDGKVYHADFDSVTTTSTFHKNQPYGTLTLPIRRIDGEAL